MIIYFFFVPEHTMISQPDAPFEEAETVHERIPVVFNKLARGKYFICKIIEKKNVSTIPGYREAARN